MGALALALTCLALACGQQQPSTGQLHVGLLATDPGGIWTGNVIHGAELAVAQANEAGGFVFGGVNYEVVLHSRPTGDTPEQAMRGARELINQEGVVALIGPMFSQTAIPVAQVAESARLPMITPTATSSEVTAGSSYAFRVSPTNDDVGAAIARFVGQRLGAQRVATLYDVARPYSRGLAEAFEHSFEAAGGEIVGRETYVSGSEQFDEPLRRLQALGADALFLPNDVTDSGRQIAHARVLGMDLDFVGGDGWSRELASVHNGTYFVDYWHSELPYVSNKKFLADFEARFDRPPLNSAALTYDAFGVLFAALRNSPSLEGPAIRDALAALDAYSGVSSEISFGGRADPQRSILILQAVGGTAQIYEVLDP